MLNTKQGENKMNDKILIDLTPNGLPGVSVLTEKTIVDEGIATFPLTKARARKLVKMLKQQVRTYLPTIMQGETYNDGFEIMDKQKFDDDLVWVAIYDHIGNNKPITVVRSGEA